MTREQKTSTRLSDVCMIVSAQARHYPSSHGNVHPRKPRQLETAAGHNQEGVKIVPILLFHPRSRVQSPPRAKLDAPLYKHCDGFLPDLPRRRE